MKRTAVIAALLALFSLSGGCVRENPDYDPAGDAGDVDTDADGDADSDTDTDADSDSCQQQAYMACNGNGDVAWYDSCDQPGAVVTDCEDSVGQCVVDGGVASCVCDGHQTSTSGCYDCETGWGGAACAVCELGYNGEECDGCMTGYTAQGGECIYSDWCGEDRLWLVEGEIPGLLRQDTEFNFTGTSSEPVVKDTATTLMWHRCLQGQTWNGTTCSGSGSSIAYSDAQFACASPYGGFSDWRLPSQDEIISILSLAWPSTLSSVVFPGVDPYSIWSRAQVGGDNVLSIFILGQLSYAVSIDDVPVLCVRDDSPAYPSTRFILGAADGSTVIDTWTGLEWRRCFLGHSLIEGACYGTTEKKTWANATTACADEYDGHTDWFLPSIRQLESLSLQCNSEHMTWSAFPLTEEHSDDMVVWSSTDAETRDENDAYDFGGPEIVRLGWYTPTSVMCARLAD